jgi:hypothetical protein
VGTADGFKGVDETTPVTDAIVPPVTPRVDVNVSVVINGL